MRRFDAVLLDVGGVLVLPDPTVIGPLLAYYGGDPAIDRHRRAHYVGMHAKSAAAAGESDWAVYDDAYVDAVGVGPDDRDEAARVLGRSRGPDWWRWPIPESVHALGLLARSGTAVGIVSNASGQVEAMLRRGVAQVGPGRGADVRVIVDSHVVGVAKPDPAIFDHALPALVGSDPGSATDVDRSRIAYVGDSVTIDVAAATAAGLHPILLDPYDLQTGATFERVTSLTALAEELATTPG